MIQLTPEEIALIQRNRQKVLESRSEFMALANAVCEETGIPFSAVCAVTRGTVEVCQTRALICRIAADRGFPVGAIARFIRRDRTTVIHAISTTKKTDKSVLQRDGQDG
jgi:chromosomal replication initiation ATPase DnaA